MFVFRSKNINFFDDENFKNFKKNIVYDNKISFSEKDLYFELLDKKKSKEEIFNVLENLHFNYDTLTFNTLGVRHDILTIKPGVIGREYFKTISCKNLDSFDVERPILFQVISGSGKIVYVKENLDNEIFIREVKKGDIVYLERETLFSIYNVSFDKLIVSYLTNKETRFVVNNFKEEGGMPLFVTKLGLIRNLNIKPNYNILEEDGSNIEDLSLDEKKSIYEQFVEFPEKFKQLLF